MKREMTIRQIASRRRGWARALIVAVLSPVLSAAAVGTYCGYLQLVGNFHEVVAGQVYRSAQPSAAEVASYQKRYHIRSIINLRGSNFGKGWYDDEIAASQADHITHIDFRMSSREHFTRDRAARLVNLMRGAPKPLLIHCKAGADRSGLAAALYLAGVAKAGEVVSERELSILYGHVGIPVLSASYAMDRSWESLESWLGYRGS